MEYTFVGAGWSYPLRTDMGGRIALSRGDAEIGEAIRLILGTARGERPMRPEFGCGIHDVVFGSADSGLAGRLSYEVRAALTRWEPRIVVDDVLVSFDPDQPVAFIDVRYTISDTNDPRNLVFPFYFIPEEE